MRDRKELARLIREGLASVAENLMEAKCGFFEGDYRASEIRFRIWARKFGKTSTRECPLKSKWLKLDREHQAQDRARREVLEAPLRQRRLLEREMLNAGIEAGFKKLACKYHPDKGGTNDEMRALIEARERMRRMVV